MKTLRQKVKWLNAPKTPNLIERTFGQSIKVAASHSFEPIAFKATEESAQEKDDQVGNGDDSVDNEAGDAGHPHHKE